MLKHALLHLDKPMKINTKLIAIAKNEGAYLPQWIYHHFSIGFDEIEIYINDTTDNSIEICEKIQKNHSGLTFHIADKLRLESVREQRSFQISAYNNSLHNSSNTTHLMALDLDEYLICRNMNEKLSTLLKRQKSPDCLSFLWYSDDYSSKKSFSHPLQPENTIYRMDHVKTISKLSKKVHSCSHHNFIYKSEEKVINLLGGTIIRLDDKINTQSRRSKLAKEQLNALSSKSPEPWFVLHCIYKSEEEYLASLCRGRGHNNDQRPLKVNRWGMSPYPFYPKEPIQWNPSKSKIDQYKIGLQTFLQKNNLIKELNKARMSIKESTYYLNELLKEQPHLRSDYKKIFVGTKYA